MRKVKNGYRALSCQELVNLFTLVPKKDIIECHIGSVALNETTQ